MSLVIKNITKKYGSTTALDGISFEVKKGDITGLIGANGAGKSTLLKIITGVIPADGGEVSIAGMNISENSLEVKKITGYLPENNPLYGDMYIREYLYYAAGFYKGMNDKKSRVDKIISDTGLLPESRKKISELSKGYRQRVGIAQALLHDPEILILDEPTSGLDPNQIIEIRNLISETGKNKIVLLSTHILQEVEAICDKVIVIRKGKIVADGSPGDISNAHFDQTITIMVEFDKDPGVQKLSALEGVTRAIQLSPFKFLVESDYSADIRPVLFKYAVSEGLTVLSMQRKEKSLEEVFAELTR